MKPEDLIRQMNTYYDRRALEHDRLMSYTDNASMEALLKPIIDLIEPLISGRRVLEIACGTGNWTQVLAKRAASVYATDINQSVLDIARTKPLEGNATFATHDAYTIGELGEQFEAAFAADWWSHVPRSALPKFLTSLHSALVPGATVIMLDMTFREFFRNETAYTNAEGNRVSLRTDSEGREYPVVKNFPTAEELRELLADHAESLEFYENDSLERWLLIYTVNTAPSA